MADVSLPDRSQNFLCLSSVQVLAKVHTSFIASWPPLRPQPPSLRLKSLSLSLNSFMAPA